MFEYFFVFKFFIISFIVSLLLTSLSILLVYQKPEVEKHSSYDVGLILLVMLEANLMLNFI
jgi:hypothetical protein